MALSRKNFMRYASALAVGAWSTFKEIEVRASVAEFPDVSANMDDYWKAVRSAFPLDPDFSYLNNGTLGPSPYLVIEATHAGMMLGDRSGIYTGYEFVPHELGNLLGGNEDEFALTHNVTEGNNICCWGLPLKRGDEVLLSTHEHVGNAFPWLNRQKLHGIVIKTFAPGNTAAETLEHVAAAITSKTRVIASPHIPCTQGQIFPVKEICQLARDKGIYSVIDGAHGPGMIPINLHDLGCDAYASCCHKWLLGPKGTGFLYVRKSFQDILQTYFVAGGGDKGNWNFASTPIKTTEYADGAHRYYGGTQNLGLWKGVSAAISFINSVGMNRVNERIHELGGYTQNRLLSLQDKVQMLTPVEPISRAGIIGFRLHNMASEKFFMLCMDHRVRIRYVQENGLNSLRVSTHIYNSYADIDKLITLIEQFG